MALLLDGPKGRVAVRLAEEFRAWVLGSRIMGLGFGICGLGSMVLVTFPK